MRSMYRPLAHHRVVSFFSFLFLFAAFVLLLLVAVSLPIIKPVFLLSVISTAKGEPPTSIATELRFGVWGFCASRLVSTQSKYPPPSYQPSSVLHQPNWHESGVCYGPKLGYDVPPEIVSYAGVPPSIVDAIEKSLQLILVLHPVACGLSFIGFIFSLFLGPHNMAIITLIIAIITGLATTIVFAIDLALVFVTRKGISDFSNFHFDVRPGVGLWMVLASLVATWIAILFLSARACYCCCVNS
jgi:hypothetical protein